MANRFTATEKWIDPWFCELNEKDKLFWIYIVDNCDHAGIWQVNWPLVRFHIKDYVFNEKVFNSRIIKLKNDKWFIPKFIEFQYKTGLNPENRAHQSVINILKKEGAYKGLERGIKARKDTDKDKDKDKDKYLDFVLLTKEEYEKLVDKFGKTIAESFIDKLNNGIGSKGYKYQSHYHTILNWVKRDGILPQIKPKKPVPMNEEEQKKVAALVHETVKKMKVGKCLIIQEAGKKNTER